MHAVYTQQHFKQQAPERERRWNSRELLSWQSMFGETDSFRDSLVREVDDAFFRSAAAVTLISVDVFGFLSQAAHGHVWDRKACKEWLRNADNVMEK